MILSGHLLEARAVSGREQSIQLTQSALNGSIIISGEDFDFVFIKLLVEEL